MKNIIIKTIKLLSKCKEHKYITSICIFAIYVLFLDSESFVTQAEYYAKIKRSQTEKAYYINKIRQDSLKFSQLQSSDENLIRFAREEYLMKTDYEDVFVIREIEK